ncbi:hypothetical protein XENOCAPTIV_019182, partial [Xenoophorus captivus]
MCSGTHSSLSGSASPPNGPPALYNPWCRSRRSPDGFIPQNHRGTGAELRFSCPKHTQLQRKESRR